MAGSVIESSSLDCAVCLQTCIHPTELPCGHVFCFLCVKGVANQSKRCAMCRQEIPCDFFNHPKLLDTSQGGEGLDDEYQWYYEGKNGWWKYDVRTNNELDSAFQSGLRNCELLIAGFLYIIDFDSMIQYRRSDPMRKRRIKRDAVSVPSKGVAGIRLKNNTGEERPKSPESGPAADGHDGVTSDAVNRITTLSLDSVLVLTSDDSVRQHMDTDNSNGENSNGE